MNGPEEQRKHFDMMLRAARRENLKGSARLVGELGSLYLNSPRVYLDAIMVFIECELQFQRALQEALELYDGNLEFIAKFQADRLEFFRDFKAALARTEPDNS